MRSAVLFLLVIGVFSLFLSMRYESMQPVTVQEPQLQAPEESVQTARPSPKEQHAAVNVKQITDMPEPEEMWKQEKKQLHKEASEGSVSAQRELGLLYVHGGKDEQDFKKGYYWFGRAAEQKDPLSQVYIARYHAGDFSFPGFEPSLEVAAVILEGLDDTAYAEIRPLRERVKKMMEEKAKEN